MSNLFDLLNTLYHENDLTISQISEATGYSPTHIHRTLKKLCLLKDKSKIYKKINESRKNTIAKNMVRNKQKEVATYN